MEKLIVLVTVAAAMAYAPFSTALEFGATLAGVGVVLGILFKKGFDGGKRLLVSLFLLTVFIALYFITIVIIVVKEPSLGGYINI